MRQLMTSLGLTAVLVATTAACGGSSGGSPGGSTGGGPAQHPSSLVGTVGKNDAFSIALTDPSGKAITHLAAGTYKLAVHDLSSIHNFHLLGGGTNDATTVPGKTTKTFTVTFKPGTYTFQCDIHVSSMKGTFTVS